MKNLPIPKSKYIMSTDWKIDEFITSLNKRGIEITISLDAVSKTNAVTFTVRHRYRDKGLIDALLRTFFGGVKIG